MDLWQISFMMVYVSAPSTRTLTLHPREGKRNPRDVNPSPNQLNFSKFPQKHHHPWALLSHQVIISTNLPNLSQPCQEYRLMSI